MNSLDKKKYMKFCNLQNTSYVPGAAQIVWSMTMSMIVVWDMSLAI